MRCFNFFREINAGSLLTIEMKIIILAGGKGIRLWPLSRETFPKQFLPLEKRSLFRQTVDRCLSIEKPKNIFISTNSNYSFYVEEALKGTKIKKDNIIIEPFSKNTAPAILFAIKKFKKEFKAKDNELVLVCPSDHFISPEDNFLKDIEKAQKISSLGFITTFGIKPTSPETGYGYIGAEEISLKEGNLEYYRVERFIEKPCLRKAKEFFQSKKYYWNSGIFLFPIGLMMKEFKKSAPEMLLNIDNFEKVDSAPIDKTIIEKSERVSTIPASFLWNDIGSWESFHQVRECNKDGNVIIGNVLTKDVKNSLIFGNSRLVACFGMSNITLIETNDAVFVAPKNKSQEVKKLVQELESKNRKEAFEGLKINKAWGNYMIIDEGKDYRIKKLIIYPKKKISLQSHKFRTEHFVIIKGKAKVQINGEEFIFKRGESFFIPKKKKHMVENKSNKDLEIIEIQNGNYLDEDDIKRYKEC